jgi:DNA-binding NtrC family response regulator
MRNILLILENSLEFNLTKTVLQKLGFQVLWIQKGVDMKEKLQKNFPDLVITSILGTQDQFLNEFVKVREKRGTPHFIWVGPSSRLDRLKSAQRQLIDANLPTPIQPDLLIQQVCQLFKFDSVEYLQKYRAMLSSSQNETVRVVGSVHSKEFIVDPVRAEKYSKYVENIPKQDRVFSLKEIDKRIKGDQPQGNSVDLFEKKKTFIKALFKK